MVFMGRQDVTLWDRYYHAGIEASGLLEHVEQR